ncbi:YdcH family protein [Segnochrobactraceae bacterium EtOH-i3]
MSHVPHELSEEFPREVDQIHVLRLRDAHFARLVEDYQSVNTIVHRMVARIEPVSDQTLEETRMKRLHLKDQIAAALKTARCTG